MAGMRSDAPLAKQIVRSFLQFLSSVEVAPEVDSEVVIVASQCLANAFGLDVATLNESDSELPDLIHLFRQCGYDAPSRDLPAEIPYTDSIPHSMPASDVGAPGSSRNAKDSSTIDATVGCAEENLFEHFREGLDGAGYFDGLAADTLEYREHLEKARNLFAETVKKVKKPGTAEQYILAEGFKAQGNSSMSDLRITEAIDLYTMAISLCGDNAVYYSNRAAAHTQAGKHEAAIADSNKAIQLDPNYSKAYSRLGLAYYTQGKYQEAIEKGFQKAHLLDPNSKSIQENLMVAQKKLDEERAWSRQSNSEPRDQQPQTQTSNQGSEARFSTYIPLDGQLPQSMAGLFPAVANLAAQFAGEQASTAAGSGLRGPHNVDVHPQEARMDGNMNVTVEGSDPQFANLMQSMLQMFAGTSNQNRSEPPNQNNSQQNQEHGT